MFREIHEDENGIKTSLYFSAFFKIYFIYIIFKVIVFSQGLHSKQHEIHDFQHGSNYSVRLLKTARLVHRRPKITMLP